jgi:hypothetical protein
MQRLQKIWQDNEIAKMTDVVKTLSFAESSFIFKYIEKHKPKVILEFGTQHAVSTRIFYEICKSFGYEPTIHCFDIVDEIKYISKDKIIFHQEDITGIELAVINELTPDLIFLDAHPYELTSNLVDICLAQKINFMAHDVSLEIHERARVQSDNFQNKSKYTNWELFILMEKINNDLDKLNHYSNEEMAINIIRDRFGLAVIEFKK